MRWLLTRCENSRLSALIGAGLLGLVTLSQPVAAQAPIAPTAPAVSETPQAATRQLLDAVVFVGASATAGFGVIVTDPDGQKRSLPLPLSAGFAGAVSNLKPEATPRNFGSSLFFLSPIITGSAQIDRALELKPTLVVGVDFLFWYGYGDDNGKGGKLDAESERLDKLALGFSQLERIDPSVPIVVGDLPDMSAAVGKMLSRRQMPELKTLEAMNAKLKEWAATRPNVILFPLSELVNKLKTGETITIASMEFKREGGRLLQSDELHPTARGSIAMSLRVAELLREKFGEKAAIETTTDEKTAQRRSHEAAERALALRSGGVKFDPKGGIESGTAPPKTPAAPPGQ
jgi:hypothetical protein